MPAYTYALARQGAPALGRVSPIAPPTLPGQMGFVTPPSTGPVPITPPPRPVVPHLFPQARFGAPVPQRQRYS